MTPKLTKEERFSLIQRALKGEKVASLCREAGISRVLFYRWLKRYEEGGRVKLGQLKTGRPKKIIVHKKAQYTHLSPHDREMMIKEVMEQGSDATEVAEKYAISRVTLYKWLNRYKEAGEGMKETAFLPRERHIDRYFRQTPEKHEESLLALVNKHPDYGIRRLVANLPQIGGKPLIGHHGVQNILNRHNLNTFALRQAYAQSQITPVTESISGILDKVAGFFRIEPEARHEYVKKGSKIALGVFLSIAFFGLASAIIRSFGGADVASPIGMFFAFTALFMGSIFFLYSFKYYLTMAVVLSFSQKDANMDRSRGAPKKNILNWLLGLNGDKDSMTGTSSPVGLEPNLDHVALKKHPFVSVQIPFYNEKNVVERSIEAAINFDYPEYEVILCDDSTDETTNIIRNFQKNYLGKRESLKTTEGEGWTLTEVEIRKGLTLRHLHRTTRGGFKGGALNLALKLINPKAEFVSVFDADFVPYPDSLNLFLKYFKVQNNYSEDYSGSKVAAVQGYQWHVLNKSENWITRGIRSEYAGSYVIERSGIEIYGGLKQISGSVYMIRRKPLEEAGWGVSITEDFELTLKLYEKGYRVVYTPYIQAPAECVSTIKRLIRQRMRWSEGHSQNIKRMFKKILLNPKLTLAEKFEFIYLSPYYLQAFFFLVGTFAWLISESVFPARLPFWTSLWGWSLVLTNLFALPLMNAVGMFLEESDDRDYLGLASFVALSYLLVPFQAYSSVKGFLEEKEGPWFRTPKTGRITDIFARGKFYRFISGILPGRANQVAEDRASAFRASMSMTDNRYLALTTANNRFNNFAITRGRLTWLGKVTLSVLLMITTSLLYYSKNIQLAYADTWATPLKLDVGTGDAGLPAWGNWLSNATTYSAGTTFVRIGNLYANLTGTSNKYYWFTNLWPNGATDAVIPGGNYYIQFAKQGNEVVGGTNHMNVIMQLLVTSNNEATKTQIAANRYTIRLNNASNTLMQFYIGNVVTRNITSAAKNRLVFRIYYNNGSAGCKANVNCTWNMAINNTNIPARLIIPAAGITIPEIPKPLIVAIFLVIIPVMPTIISGRLRRPGQNIFQEFGLAWKELMRKLLGKDVELDDLPV